jgi:hypothetical protein
MAAAERGRSVCPRCGLPINRKKRHFAHRVLSVLYPVRYYTCTKECGWSGLRPSTSELRARKRRLTRLIIILLLALGGLAVVRRLVANWSQPVSEEEVDG